MTDRAKSILKIGGFFAITALLVWGVWLVFFRVPESAPAPGAQQSAVQGQLPGNIEGPSGTIQEPAGQRALLPEPEYATGSFEPDTVAIGGRTATEALVQSSVEFPKAAGSGFNYYDFANESFYRISESGGEPVLLATQQFPQVQEVTWSGSGDAAILEFPDGSNIYYNFKTNTQATLPREAREFSFSSDEKQVAYEYIGQNTDDRWIVVSSATGGQQRAIQPIGRESINIAVNWSPDASVVATYREPTSGKGEEVFFIGLNNENLLSLQTNGLGFEGAWSPEGTQMLYSVYAESTEYNPVLYIADAQGDRIGLHNRTLKLATWPDKCVFASEETLYCAVPNRLEEGSGVYRELAANTTDSVYKIDLVHNISTLVAFPEDVSGSGYKINTLMIGDNGDSLYFTDDIQGQIHRMRLR